MIDIDFGSPRWDQVKVIPRFLPHWRVGKLLVVYLADVLPFRQLMDRKAAMLTSKGFLWFKMVKPWETDDLTKALTRESGSRLGFRITTADYRHIAVAIDRWQETSWLNNSGPSSRTVSLLAVEDGESYWFRTLSSFNHILKHADTFSQLDGNFDDSGAFSISDFQHFDV